MKHIKKIITIALALSMVMAMAVSVSADEISAGAQTDPGITSTGGTDSTEVRLTIGNGDGSSGAGAGNGAFKVTVPTYLPFAIGNDGTVSVADNAKIVNSSNGPVKVTNVTATGANSWAIAANGTDFKSVKVDTKQFTMDLNTDHFPAAETGAASELTLTPANWGSIAGDGTEFALSYDGSFATQSSNVNVKVADIVFTVAWDTVA